MRGRLLSVVALVLAVAFIGTTVTSYHVTRDALKQSVVETELPLTGDTIYSEIQADLVQPIFISSQMANDTFLRDWILSGETDPEAMTRYLESVRSKYGFFTAFFVSEFSRDYYHFSGVTKAVDENDPRDEWFFRVRGMTSDYEINVDPNQQQDDKTTIFINYRVYDYQNRFIGVTGVGMDLDTMGQIINRYRSDFSRTVYFIDQTGNVTLHPNREISYRKNINAIPGISDIANTILKNPGESFEFQQDDETILLNTRYIPELEWILMVEQSESDATKAAGRGITLNVIIGLVAILVTGLAIFLAIARFQNRLEEMATTDPLTGLNNRQVFDIALRHAVERAKRTKQPLSIIIIDLDHFKLINDRHGHLTGDEVLKSSANLLKTSVRTSDILARWGGEEFVLLMENCIQEAALEAANTLRRKLSESTPVNTLKALKQTASFGVATLSGNEQPEALMDRADRALYKAKHDGRNCVRAATPIPN